MSRKCEPSRRYRCYAEPSAWDGSRVALSAEEWHHLHRVLRAKAGDAVTVFDGQGREADARISSGGSGVLETAGAVRTRKPPACTLILTQALPKSRGMDGIVEKATELGVGVIRPIVSDRAIMRPDSSKREACGERWRRIALNAARQCGTAWTPRVHPVEPFETALADVMRADVVFLGCTDAGSAPLRLAMEQRAAPAPATVGLMIGPEGDWTDDEVACAVAAGAIPVSFGSRILRVETAALFGLSVLASRFLG